MQTTPLSPDDPPELGGFELLGRIGHGGMGQVYLGESPGGEAAALKVIKPALVDGTTRQRFAQEIEILKSVWGARVAALLDADPEADQPWLATEYVDGPDLRRFTDSYGPLPTVLVAALGATLAEALASVHKQGLLHRDLKPANILLGPNGPKIIDFGLAVFAESSVTLTAPNTVVGTPSCMAPEQANGVKPLAPAVDVYALGALLLFAATGHYPYQAQNINVVFHMVTDRSVEPDLSGAPDDLRSLLAAMLAYETGDRPPLPEVVQRCRAVIETQGLTAAQARRKLTTYATAMAATTTGTPEGMATATAQPHGQESSIVREPPASAVPTVPLLPLPEPVKSKRTPTHVDPRPLSPTDAVPVAERPRGKRPAGRSLRDSAEARRIAQSLREAYAARAPF